MPQITIDKTNVDSLENLITRIASIQKTVKVRVDEESDFGKKFIEKLTRGIDTQECFKILKKYF